MPLTNLNPLGIIFALVALVAWGLADFFIQRSTRQVGRIRKIKGKKFGNLIVLFYITLAGSLILFPFIYHQLPGLWAAVNWRDWLILLTTSLVILFAAIFDFQALKLGKISVIDPVFAFEIPVTAILAWVIIKEFITPSQGLFVCLVFIGILLVSLSSLPGGKRWRIKIEPGVFFAVLATLGMGAVNFLFGIGARATSPLMINWFVNVFITLVIFIYLLARSDIKNLLIPFKKQTSLILHTTWWNNLAWIAFAYSTLYIPIAIATGISESYIALAVILGLVFNKEKLKIHQIVGLVMVILSAVWLSLGFDF